MNRLIMIALFVWAAVSVCQQYGIRPTMLLNAHQGMPCPAKFFERRLAADASKGSRSIRLTDVNHLPTGKGGGDRRL